MERKLLFCQDMDKIFNKKNVTLLGSNSDKRHAGLTQWLRTAEMVTNDTKMCLKCKSDGEKCKYISKMKGFEIQARDIRNPRPD